MLQYMTNLAYQCSQNGRVCCNICDFSSLTNHKWVNVLQHNICNSFLIANIEGSVTSLDCNHGVCPQTLGAATCTITGNSAAWFFPPYDYIARITSESVNTISNKGFTAALVSNNSGITTNLSYIATTDKNGTQIMCVDLEIRNSSAETCTIMISGMSLTVSHITALHFKILQVNLLQDWIL